MILSRPFYLMAAAALLAGCSTTNPTASHSTTLTPGDASAPSQVTPSETLAIAQRLATHPWRPFAKNILHGKDKAGVEVQTPDAGFKEQPERPGWWLPGEVNTGVPYKWGGFDGPEAFDSAVANGLAAGDVSSPAKRRADNAAVSAQAVGVDCSGFVSRCLKLPTIRDSTQLPGVCNLLPGPQDLRPGDLLNIPHRHVILCAGWVTPDHRWIYYYETGGPPDYWKPGLKQAPVDALIALGYQPLRYRGMATTTATDGKQVLTRGARTAAAVVTNPVVGEE
jgi:cell wall-associated NlpC family hydrolase